MANDAADLGMWLYILRKALESSLVMLAEDKGLDWLSEFEDELTDDIKRTVTQSISPEVEFTTIDRGIDTLKLVFNNVRIRIASRE